MSIARKLYVTKLLQTRVSHTDIPVWNTLTTVPLRRLCLRAHISPRNEEEGVKKESPIVRVRL